MLMRMLWMLLVMACRMQRRSRSRQLLAAALLGA
jgi:hypothetical protein